MYPICFITKTKIVKKNLQLKISIINAENSLLSNYEIFNFHVSTQYPSINEDIACKQCCHRCCFHFTFSIYIAYRPKTEYFGLSYIWFCTTKMLRIFPFILLGLLTLDYAALNRLDQLSSKGTLLRFYNVPFYMICCYVL